MPNFLIIGAPKAGTSSLYNYLKEHPQIYMSPIKEPKFFALEGENVDFQGPQDYTKDYITDIETYCGLFNNLKQEIAIGEASPWYLHIPKSAECIQYWIPEVKLIAILRDPVERAYSQFLSLVQRNFEPLTDFAQALSVEPERIINNWSPRWHYKSRGFYYTQLKRYFDRFDRKQMKIYLYEDFRFDSCGVVQDIFHFLGVDDTFIPNISKKHNVTKLPRNKTLHKLFSQQNKIKSILAPFFSPKMRQHISSTLTDINTKPKPELQPEIRRKLIEEYQQDILKLQDLIQRDLSQWLKV